MWSRTPSASATSSSNRCRNSVSPMGSGGGGVPMFTVQKRFWVLRIRSPKSLKGGGEVGEVGQYPQLNPPSTICRPKPRARFTTPSVVRLPPLG